MAYAEGILDLALEVGDGAPVRRIQVRIGALHGIVSDSLQFCFQLAAHDTPAADAVLEVSTILPRIRCKQCSLESTPDASPLQCPTCHAFEFDVLNGEEVLVDGVELDDGWRRRPDADPVMESFAHAHLREHAASGEH